MDKEMMQALMADAEKLAHLTGEDHTPEFLADCEACDGKGYVAETIHVYEPGCGFSHPDVKETPCQACNGNGWFICEVEGNVASCNHWPGQPRCGVCGMGYSPDERRT